MIGENRKRPKSLAIILFSALVVLFAFQINPVLADVPTVESIEPWTSGTDTILNITIRHGSPSSGHFVWQIEVDIDGTVHIKELEPQLTVTFVAQYNMSELVGTPTVKVRADCNLHPWSDWSEPVMVPEFSTISLLLILAIVSIAVLLLKSRA